MGHRALVAYERADGLYNVHYSHWGAANLQLKGCISAATPFGGEDTDSEWARNFMAALADGLDADAIGGNLAEQHPTGTLVEPDPIAIGCSREEILTEYLDFLHHEAYFEVSRQFEVTAYRTLWFGLQYECDAIDEGETVGNGALTTVRWYNGEPVGDGYLRGQFQGLKDVVGFQPGILVRIGNGFFIAFDSDDGQPGSTTNSRLPDGLSDQWGLGGELNPSESGVFKDVIDVIADGGKVRPVEDFRNPVGLRFTCLEQLLHCRW